LNIEKVEIKVSAGDLMHKQTIITINLNLSETVKENSNRNSAP
jgi:hypothetical protein